MIIIEKINKWRRGNMIDIICYRKVNIFLFLDEKEIGLVELRKKLNDDSNHIDQYINPMIDNNLLKIRKDKYRSYVILTKKGLLIKKNLEIIFNKLR